MSAEHAGASSKDNRPSKRMKRAGTNGQSLTEDADRSNPYLAHMYENESEDFKQGSGGRSGGKRKRDGVVGSLTSYPRHETTAAMAKIAEDGPLNPFTDRPLSKQYFAILEKRRDLPVHAQR